LFSATTEPINLTPLKNLRVTANETSAVADLQESQHPPAKASSMYNAPLWRLGLNLAGAIPGGLLRGIASTASAFYAKAKPARKEIVVNNLLPVLGNRADAERAASKMFSNLGSKLVDVLRCEAGKPARDMLAELVNADYIIEAQSRGQGTLIVTPHLGNWEFGGYVLAERGIKLSVVTLVEPGEGLTELRQNCRARSGIETIIIGEDPFAIVDGYRVELLPPVAYDRAALNERSARQQLTQNIVRTFEPSVRKYADQWYHFIPIWPAQ
jgi:lauroyl/myristoyl acyltransferase